MCTFIFISQAMHFFGYLSTDIIEIFLHDVFSRNTKRVMRNCGILLSVKTIQVMTKCYMERFFQLIYA